MCNNPTLRMQSVYSRALAMLHSFITVFLKLLEQTVILKKENVTLFDVSPIIQYDKAPSFIEDAEGRGGSSAFFMQQTKQFPISVSKHTK